jgi:hypothetical protein
VDDEGRPNFYKLIAIARDDYSAIARFWHYFGNNANLAKKAHPTLIPHDRLFKADV